MIQETNLQPFCISQSVAQNERSKSDPLITIATLEIGYRQNVRKFMEENFTVLPQSNADIFSADVVCIGDNTHISSQDDAIAGELLRFLCRDGDIVLVEGVGSGETAGKEEELLTDLIERKITVLGWDQPEIQKEVLKKVPAAIELQKRLEAEKDPDKIKALLKEQKDLVASMTALAVPPRNLSILNTVKSIYSSKRIFITAGSGHFTLDPELIEKLKASKGRVAVLIPKFDKKAPIEELGNFYSGLSKDTFDRSLLVKLPGGASRRFWAGWFKGGATARSGDLLSPDMDTLGAFNARQLGLEQASTYKVLSVRDYNGSKVNPNMVPPIPPLNMGVPSFSF